MHQKLVYFNFDSFWRENSNMWALSNRAYLNLTWVECKWWKLYGVWSSCMSLGLWLSHQCLENYFWASGRLVSRAESTMFEIPQKCLIWILVPKILLICLYRYFSKYFNFHAKNDQKLQFCRFYCRFHLWMEIARFVRNFAKWDFLSDF